MDLQQLRNAARAIALIWAGWWTLFGLLAGIGEGYDAAGIFLHAAFPGLFFLMAAIVAWRWEVLGAFLLLGQALLAVIIFWFARTPFGFLTLALPPFVAAALFLIHWLKPRAMRNRTSES